MKPLYEDQITSDEWISLCDYGFDEINEPWINSKSINIFNSNSGIGSRGVIYCGTNQSAKNLLTSLPENGNFIIVTRDNDKSIDEELYSLKPKSVKHWFAINCAVNHLDIIAIPYGVAGISGYNKTLEIVGKTIDRDINLKEIYVRCNINNEMIFPHDRRVCVDTLRVNDNATVIENNLDGLTNFSFMRSHIFVAAPVGTGKDTMRVSEAFSMGAIPILTDCIELRNAYDDTPALFTQDWINYTYGNIETSTDKIRMSYWKQELLKQKQLYGIIN